MVLLYSCYYGRPADEARLEAGGNSSAVGSGAVGSVAVGSVAVGKRVLPDLGPSLLDGRVLLALLNSADPEACPYDPLGPDTGERRAQVKPSTLPRCCGG